MASAPPGLRGLLGVFLAANATALRWLLRFDGTTRQLTLSYGAALFAIGSVAPGISELLSLRPEGSSMVGAILGLTTRPLLKSLMRLASNLRQDAIGILRSWISRRWD